MKFASKIAEEFAEENELTLEDFRNYKIEKVYKHHVEEKIKEKQRANKIAAKSRTCECCTDKIWPSKQSLDKHLESNHSRLFFALKDISLKNQLLTRLSNKISVLEVQLSSYKQRTEDLEEIIQNSQNSQNNVAVECEDTDSESES